MLAPDKEILLSEKMHHIVSNFRNRASNVRQRLEETPSPQGNVKFRSTLQ